MSETRSAIEKLLNLDFASDPRLSRFKVPGGTTKDISKPVGKMVITPELARDWLTYRIYVPDTTPTDIQRTDMRPNRRISGNRVKNHWAPILRNGDWDEHNARSMCITEDGFILDGQHTLAAVAFTEISIKIQVTKNVPWGSFGNIDTPLTRTPQQFLHGYRHPALVSSAVKHIIPVLEGRETLTAQARTASNSEVYRIAELFPQLKGDWSAEAKAITTKIGLPSGPLLAHIVVAMTAGGSPDHVQKFLNGLNTGQNLSANDPRYRLRDKFHDIRNSKKHLHVMANKISGNEHVAQVNLLRFAFNAWMEGRELERLQVGSGTTLTNMWGADQVRAWYKEVQ